MAGEIGRLARPTPSRLSIRRLCPRRSSVRVRTNNHVKADLPTFHEYRIGCNKLFRLV
jgi:hypothetical protein